MDYKNIFSPETIGKMNSRSADNLRHILGNKTLMQTLISSGKLLQEIMELEKPYIPQLEELAIQMVEDMYPIITDDNIVIDAKIVSMNDVNQSLDEIKINKPSPFVKGKTYNVDQFGNGKWVPWEYEWGDEKYYYFTNSSYERIGIEPHEAGSQVKQYKRDLNENTPESKRRVINGITQGAALKGTFSFYMFKEYLDAIDPTLVEKYNQLMKEVFGVYDDPNAIAMFLQQIAMGNKMGGGSSKVIVNEIKINHPTNYKKAYAECHSYEEYIKYGKQGDYFVVNKDTNKILASFKTYNVGRWVDKLTSMNPTYQRRSHSMMVNPPDWMEDPTEINPDDPNNWDNSGLVQMINKHQPVNEIKINKPNQYIFKCNDGSSYRGSLFYGNQIISKSGYLSDRDTIVEINDKPKINIEDFYYFHGGYRLNKPFIIKNQSPIDEIKINKPEFSEEKKYQLFYDIVEDIEDEYPEWDSGKQWGEAKKRYKQKYGKDFDKPLNEQEQKKITIRARAICFPMLVHEIIKGLYELVSLQGFQGTKDQNQAVANKVDKLEHEPEDIKYGQQIFEALNDIYVDSGFEDQRIREFFFADVYQMGDQEFIEFIENAINGQLTPTQSRWVNTTLKEISIDLRDDDYDNTGLDEIRIRKPDDSFSITPTGKKKLRAFVQWLRAGEVLEVSDAIHEVNELTEQYPFLWDLFNLYIYSDIYGENLIKINNINDINLVHKNFQDRFGEVRDVQSMMRGWLENKYITNIKI